MSAPQRFASVAAALEAFAAGRCKRWVSVEGHQIDLVQAQAEAGRVREEPSAMAPHDPLGAFEDVGGSRHTWDGMVAVNVAAELARAANVLPELAVPEVAPLSRVLTEEEDGAVYYTTKAGSRVKIMEPLPDASAHRCPWCSRPWDGAP